VHTGLDERAPDIERIDFLPDRVDEAFYARLARMIERSAGKRALPAIGGEIDGSSAALLAQMRKGCAHYLDRADQIGVDLAEDLVISIL
jgi:hypothetical protein